MGSSRPFRQDQIALLIIAGVLLALAGFHAIQSLVVYSRYRQTTGTVTAFEESTDQKGTTSTTAVVTYQVGGRAYKTYGENAMSFLYGRHRLGEVVKVRYDPSEPGTAVLDSFSERWLLSIIASVLGALALGGWGVLWFLRRSTPSGATSVPPPLPATDPPPSLSAVP
jgi:hypothetical protein